MGVLPTRRTKNSCSMTCAEIVRSDGSLSSSLPKRVGCPGYCVLTYSSSAHWDFSWIDSTCVTSDIPHASAMHEIMAGHNNHNSQSLVINRFFMKLFTTKSIETVKYRQEYFDFSLPSVLWAKRV